jgi:hypothetical protein
MVLGELDPQYRGKSVILAYAGGDPPASFSALRLVVQVDVHGGRSVRDVSRIELAKPRKRAHRLTNVCLGSLADITARLCHVRFTPDNGHSSVRAGCPKSAISRHGDWFEAKLAPR